MKNTFLNERTIVTNGTKSETSCTSSEDDEDTDDHESKAPRNKTLKKIKIKKCLSIDKNDNSEKVYNKSLSSYPRACEFCGKIYTYRQVFFAHRKRCNSYTNYLDLHPKNISEYICYYCNKYFNRKYNLQKHLNSEVCVRKKIECCKETNNLLTDSVLDDFQIVEHDEVKEYTCAHCGKIFKKKCNLQRHLNRSVCSERDTLKRCKLKCWESECPALFYKQIDLVQHLREQHQKTLSVDRLEFPSIDAFEKWKNEENSIKFMNARKLTGSKRSSKGTSYYFVCQFYRKNESESTKRKTNRRKTVGIVPNTKCPSRILVKECDSKVHVTYISTHNHDLYDPLEKKPLSLSMKALVKKRHISGMKFKDECVRTLEDPGGGAWEVVCGNDDKQRTYNVRRINESCHLNDCVVKCYEETCYNLCEHFYKCSCSKKNIFCKHMHKVHSFMNRGMFNITISDIVSPSVSLDVVDSCTTSLQFEELENEKLMFAAQNNLTKLNNYLGNEVIQQTLLSNLVKTLQSLCDQCEEIIIVNNKLAHERQITIFNQQNENNTCKHAPKPIVKRNEEVQHRNAYRNYNERSFTMPITDTMDILKPIFQPFNINILNLKSLDTHLIESEVRILESSHADFAVGWLHDAIIDSFLNIVCPSGTSIYVVDTRVSEYVVSNQHLPENWNWVPWNTIDMIFVPCKPHKNHWVLFVIHLKESKLYVLDPLTNFDTLPMLLKKYAVLINCWCNILKNFFGVYQCNITSLPHDKQNSSYNCGVFVCWYAFQYVNKYNLTDSMNTDVFRKFIYDTIINGSQTA